MHISVVKQGAMWPYSWRSKSNLVRIRIQQIQINTDPDPGRQIKMDSHGSGSETLEFGSYDRLAELSWGSFSLIGRY